MPVHRLALKPSSSIQSLIYPQKPSISTKSYSPSTKLARKLEQMTSSSKPGVRDVASRAIAFSASGPSNFTTAAYHAASALAFGGAISVLGPVKLALGIHPKLRKKANDSFQGITLAQTAQHVYKAMGYFLLTPFSPFMGAVSPKFYLEVLHRFRLIHRTKKGDQSDLIILHKPQNESSQSLIVAPGISKRKHRLSGSIGVLPPHLSPLETNSSSPKQEPVAIVKHIQQASLETPSNTDTQEVGENSTEVQVNQFTLANPTAAVPFALPADKMKPPELLGQINKSGELKLKHVVRVAKKPAEEVLVDTLRQKIPVLPSKPDDEDSNWSDDEDQPVQTSPVKPIQPINTSPIVVVTPQPVMERSPSAIDDVRAKFGHRSGAGDWQGHVNFYVADKRAAKSQETQ